MVQNINAVESVVQNIIAAKSVIQNITAAESMVQKCMAANSVVQNITAAESVVQNITAVIACLQADATAGNSPITAVIILSFICSSFPLLRQLITMCTRRALQDGVRAHEAVSLDTCAW